MVATIEALEQTGLAIEDVHAILGVHGDTDGHLQTAEAAFRIEKRAQATRQRLHGQAFAPAGEDSVVQRRGAPTCEAIQKKMWCSVDHCTL